MTPKVRFAPSPTGYLHVGNARQAVVNFLFARAHGGKFLLRLDDTDTERGKPEYEQAIFHDLAWLGLDWDETAKQSERLARYAEAAEILKASGRLYPCFESEDELSAKRAALVRRKLPPVYDRAMLKLTPEQRAAAEANGKVPYWRFKLSDGAIAWQDLVLGGREFRLNTVSDPVLIRADGTPLYTFTSVVDDIDHNTTHIIRGEDHVTNTAVQIDLFLALAGKALPRFAHLPLLNDEDGAKLSKRLGSVSLRQLRKDGIEASAITAYLARLGSRKDPAPLSLAALAQQFDLNDFGKAAARFDTKQLLALNRKILHGLSFEEVQSRLPAGADEAFWLAIRGNLDLLSESRLWFDIAHNDIPVVDLPEDAPYLATALSTLPAAPWDATTWKAWTHDLAVQTERKGRALFHPLRLALTGEDHGPDMATLLPLIGPARSAERLARAAGQ
ncbi:MAG: glutamate--tRNA ligase [Rhodospirillales bacterium 20-60-12]|nr:MAG: glutamate--tRNA ligase [Rhodospirillales bacterium 20-60-12]HQT66257.1 glutamate--tRNA ligase [Acetobacteraceae bacterium]